MTWSVYQILCLPSGASYVGRTQRVRPNLIDHRTRLNCQGHANGDLQAAWDFYGPGAFRLAVVDEGLDDRASAGLVELAVAEAKAAGRSFNIGCRERRRPAQAPFAGRRHSEATKAAIAAKIKAIRDADRLRRAS